ncbi:MAG TPA: response regulator transcription factor [Polyangiales bacterium]|jgi:DNA-binding response OmpR family regulator|nr:response regulator transcription factor [Polyangiales bacterium]
MWVLVIGSSAILQREDGGLSVLKELGCRVKAHDLWDDLDEPAFLEQPPAAILVEALDQFDAGRAALMRIRAVAALAEVPCLVAATVGQAQRLDGNDGFDDFVLVPYVPAELYMRIRRAEWRRSEFAGKERIKIGAMCIDLAGHEVTVDGRVVDLTHQEFALLKFLSQNRGRVFSREQLLNRVWGVNYYGGSRTVDIHVRRLRMKLGPVADPIETVRGVGYKMKAP